MTYLPQPVVNVVVFVLGLILGSFFNVVIWRLPRGESVVRPRSHCPSCGRLIRAVENVPIVSYILLRGRCAGCGCRIPWRYPVVEGLTGTASLIVWHCLLLPSLNNGSMWEIVHACLQVSTLLLLIPISFIDIDHLIIPDIFSLSGFSIAVATSFMPGDISPLQSALGALVGGGTLFFFGELGKVIFHKPEAMGLGDVKLMAWVGAMWGWEVALVAIFLASLSGAVVGLILLLTRKLNAAHLLPFGPFLAVGTWLAVLWGDNLVASYLLLGEHLYRVSY